MFVITLGDIIKAVIVGISITIAIVLVLANKAFDGEKKKNKKED